MFLLNFVEQKKIFVDPLETVSDCCLWWIGKVNLFIFNKTKPFGVKEKVMYKNLDQNASINGYSVRLLLAIFEAARKRSSWLDPNCAGREECLSWEECQNLSGKTTREVVLSFASKALKKQGEETLNYLSLSVDVIHLQIKSSSGFRLALGRGHEKPNCYSLHLYDKQGEFIDNVIRALLEIWPEDANGNDWFGQICLRAAGVHYLREQGFPEEVLGELCDDEVLFESQHDYPGLEIVGNSSSSVVLGKAKEGAVLNFLDDCEGIVLESGSYILMPLYSSPDQVFGDPMTPAEIVDRFCCYHQGIPDSDPTTFHFHKLVGDEGLAREILEKAIENLLTE